MQLKNVLISTKQTGLELIRQHDDMPIKKLSKTIMDQKKREHDEHYASFEMAKETLDKYSIPYKRIYLPYGAYEEFKDRDLIISFGGDGTVLNSAHYILDKTPLLTVKSSGKSVGALCKIVASQFDEIINKILEGDFHIDLWTRVQGKIGNRVDLALNEIAIRHYHDGMARYSLNYSGHNEKQDSDKFIVSTGAGSTALYRNIEYFNGSFDPKSEKLVFAAINDLKEKNYSLKHGYLYPGDVLEITSLMDFDGVIRFDGDNTKRRHDFPIGKKLYVSISNKPLYVIVPG